MFVKNWFLRLLFKCIKCLASFSLNFICIFFVFIVVSANPYSLHSLMFMNLSLNLFLFLFQSNDSWVTVQSLKTCSDGGILDPDDHLNDVVDDREQVSCLALNIFVVDLQITVFISFEVVKAFTLEQHLHYSHFLTCTTY